MAKSKNSKHYIEDDEYDYKKTFQEQRERRRDKKKSREINIDEKEFGPANTPFWKGDE